MDHIQEMLGSKSWAVVGATANPQKFGFKIYRFLKQRGIKVYAVNPGVAEILGDPCYPSLKDLPELPDAVDIVVPPQVGVGIVKECAELGIRKVWLQPGANGAEVIRTAQELGLQLVHDACIMVEYRN